MNVITFPGRGVEEIRQAFRDCVDFYLAYCAKCGHEPEQPRPVTQLAAS